MRTLDREVEVTIDPDKCTGCGACIDVCPSQTLSLRQGLAMVTGGQSLSCGHCEAACPEEAIRVRTLINDSQRFTTFRQRSDWQAPGAADIAELVQLMRSRRSCRNYRDAVAEALEDWERTGRDVLFHGAPAVILVGTRPGAACPAEDALLATQNMLLGAHAMGLGTCLIGFAVSALKQDPAISKRLGIPSAESVRAVIALGYPHAKEVYQRLPGRKALTTRIWDPVCDG